MNPLKKLQEYGQSFWLDYIRRSLINNGELNRLVEEEGLRGVTSNPTIFQKAIAGSSDYDDTIRDAVESDVHMNLPTLFEKLAIKDIQLVADILSSVYEETDGADGFVSLELSPNLAHNTEGSISEAERLWKMVDRPNVMLKVPATPEGIPVIENLVSKGINVNVTLMFSLAHYEAVANAYLRGLENCSNPHKVASVASFFLSRIDTVVDKALEEIGSPEALELKGRIAIANAKKVYKRFKEIFSGEWWERLAKRGARVQRVLWASTSTKNPEYSDVLYVEEIIGPNTVNTMPPITINAFRDHGHAEPTLNQGVDVAEAILDRLTKSGVSLNAFTEKLQADGVEAFADSFNTLLSSLEEKRLAILTGQANLRIFKLGKYNTPIEKRLEYWKEINFMRRLWAKDHTLWFSSPAPEIADRLGWLILPEIMREKIEKFVSFAEEVKAESIRYVVLLGMGGSSLAPEVFQSIFSNVKGYPELIVLDSTHPSAVRAVENKIDLHNTLFLVSSKSGTTIETISLFRYFWKKVGQVDENRGRHFVAITDPGTPLMELGKERGFRKLFLAPPDVGGRYSALTVFGLLPAALIGMDVHKFLDRSWIMSENCDFCVSSHEASGLILGAALGELTKMGRDKVTFLTTHATISFTSWLEQLLAESTGKDGKGIIPIVNEPIVLPKMYGKDRFFIFFMNNVDNELEEQAKGLEGAGRPIVRINLKDKLNVSQEIFCWEMAVAAAGAVLGIHPFNQPNVQLAKDLAKKTMEKAEKRVLNAEDVDSVTLVDHEALTKALKSWIGKAREGDYIAIQAYLSSTPETIETLQKIRWELLNRLQIATTIGYGPSFLHSTGQLHKGGPSTGLFLQLVDETAEDLEVPETNYTFGTLIQAQALGDYQALKQLGRRILRINLEQDVAGGLVRLLNLIRE